MSTNQKDQLMFDTLSTMVRDLRTFTGMKTLGHELLHACAKRDARMLRESLDLPSWFRAPTYVAKAIYQLQNFCKRYTFDNDALTDNELKSKSIHGFVESQAHVKCRLPDTHTTYLVLQKARTIVSGILGPYDKDEHVSLSRFDRNASVGLPAADAYLDNRMQHLTGSENQVAWFRQYLDEMSGVFPASHKVEHASTLTATAVPKSFKSHRIICPNTVLGGLMSSGLGEMITRRLKFNGPNIDFSHQQEKHRKMCIQGSIDRRITTLDLSKASDNIGFVHLRRLLPSDWFRVINKSRITDVSCGETTVTMNTFMTMGIGFTFPLQTLVFYSLIEAIRQLTDTKGEVSVFGDDCIYPSRIHKYVVKVFNDIGFIPNLSKTFYDVSFRESCGGHLYRGVDVCPSMPKSNEDETYEQFAYKLFNSIFTRWSKYDLPMLHDLLLWNIAAIRGVVFQVPMAYPETSGIRVSSPIKGSLVKNGILETVPSSERSSWLIPWSPVEVVFETINDWTYVSKYLFKHVIEPQAEAHEISRQYPYLWEWLRIRHASGIMRLPIGVEPNDSDVGTRSSLVLTSSDVPRYLNSVEQTIVWKKRKVNYNKIVAQIKKLTKAERGTNVVSAERQSLLLMLRKRDEFFPTVGSKGHSIHNAGPHTSSTDLWS